MKKILYFILAVFIIFTTLYLFDRCYLTTDKDTFILAYDSYNKEVDIIKSDFNFYYKAAIPNRIKLFKYRVANRQTLNVSIPIPQLNLKHKINITLDLDYKIDTNLLKFNLSEYLNESEDLFGKIIKQFIENNIRQEIYRYIQPDYIPSSIKLNEEIIIKKVMDNTKKQCINYNIIIENYNKIGSFDMPDKDFYNKELLFLKDLNQIEKNNKKELIILQGKLERENYFNKLYYEKLNQISNIIKANPDVLKYLYIDKLTDDVKVIIHSDKSAMSFGLDSYEKAGNTTKSKESQTTDIDNLK